MTYCTLEALQSARKITDADDDSELLDAISAAAAKIDQWCGRTFIKGTTATARLYYPDDAYQVSVDDFHTTTGLIIATDESDDGTFETTWTSGLYQLEPLNGIVNGVTEHPYTTIRAISTSTFPSAKRATVQVTAKWGWNAVPEPVRQACMEIAAQMYEVRNAPLGFAGISATGFDMQVGELRHARSLLAPFRKHPVGFA